MKDRDIKALQKITALQLQARQAAVRRLRDEEQRLREAEALLQQNRRADQLRDTADFARREIGADLLWQAWLDGRQREIQMDLLRVLTRIEPAQAALKTAFGRDQAVEHMAERFSSDKARQRERRGATTAETGAQTHADGIGRLPLTGG